MKRARLTLVVAIAVGLFAAIPAIAQTSGAANADELRLAITINKLELTPTQMQQVHDILAGVLSEANALKEKRDAFTQEMINFTGSSTDLETALTNFKSQMKDQTQAFHDNLKTSLDQLKGILTIEQGEILRGAFMNARNHGFAGNMPIGKGPRSPGMKPQEQGSAPNQNWMGRGPQGDNSQADMPAWMEQMKANHPELADRLAQRFGERSGKPGQMGGRAPFSRFQSSQDGKPAFDRLGDGKLLETLQKIVDILEVKLQYVQ